MKRLFFITCAAVLLTSCTIYRSFDLNLLTYGMTKRDVMNRVGRPNRVLAERLTGNGYQEVLEYNDAYGEYFALEFWNDFLTGYQFLYEDIIYVPPVYPPVRYPDRGKPIYVYPNRPGYHPAQPPQPGKPNKPGKPAKPNKPNEPNRPSYPSSPSRPGTPGRPNTPSQDRPSDVSRPTTPSSDKDNRPSNVSRPSSSNRQGRDSESSTRENSSKNEQQQPSRSSGGTRTGRTN